MYQNFTDKRLFTARKKYGNTKWLNDFKNATESDDGKKVYIPVILKWATQPFIWTKSI